MKQQKKVCKICGKEYMSGQGTGRSSVTVTCCRACSYKNHENLKKLRLERARKKPKSSHKLDYLKSKSIKMKGGNMKDEKI